MDVRRPSSASIIASVGLFVALGGTALAAHHYLISSTGQIKPSVLRKLHGARGLPGPRGAPGPQGPSASIYTLPLKGLTSVTGPIVKVPPHAVEAATAVCPSGSRAISGGGSASIAAINVTEMRSTHDGWFIIVSNATPVTVNIHAEAQCSGAGQAVAARVPSVRRAWAAAELQRRVARIRSELDASKH
jgi:hypothetical protein